MTVPKALRHAQAYAALAVVIGMVSLLCAVVNLFMDAPAFLGLVASFGLVIAALVNAAYVWAVAGRLEAESTPLDPEEYAALTEHDE